MGGRPALSDDGGPCGRGGWRARRADIVSRRTRHVCRPQRARPHRTDRRVAWSGGEGRVPGGVRPPHGGYGDVDPGPNARRGAGARHEGARGARLHGFARCDGRGPYRRPTRIRNEPRRRVHPAGRSRRGVILAWFGSNGALAARGVDPVTRVEAAAKMSLSGTRARPWFGPRRISPPSAMRSPSSGSRRWLPRPTSAH